MLYLFPNAMLDPYWNIAFYFSRLMIDLNIFSQSNRQTWSPYWNPTVELIAPVGLYSAFPFVKLTP
jgi:hypothetical protein